MTEDQFEKLARMMHENHEDVVARFETLERTVVGLDNKVDDNHTELRAKIDGINRRLDTDAMQRSEQNVVGRIEAIEKHLGIVRSISL